MTMSADYRELTAFCQILTVALRSGKPLPESLSELSARGSDNASSVWCRNISDKLAAGYSLEEACRELAGFDPVLARLMPLLGQNRLIKVLELYTSFLVSLETVREKCQSAIFYPFLVVSLLIANLLHLNFSLFPIVYKQIVLNNGAQPLMLRLLHFSEPGLWPLSLIIPLFMTFCFAGMLRALFAKKLHSNSWLAKISGLAEAIRLQELGRLQGIVGLYLEAGFSLDRAVAEAACFADNVDSETLRNVAESLAHGVEPAFALSMSPVLKNLSASVAEPTIFSDKLKFMSDSNYHCSNALMRRLSSFMSVAALLLTGLFVAVVTASFFDSYYWLIWSFS